jgi:hypothetical protein
MHRVIAVLVCLASVCPAAEPQASQHVVLPSDRPHLSYDAAYRAGRADATRDVARGYFAVEEFGRLPVFYDEYVRLVAKRYGIHIKVLAGCIVDEEIEGHAKGYNEVSHPAIERHFRRDVLSELAIEVQHRWEKKHQ